ncbi:AraC family transcriptional regulator [uncultured Flavobacterium sp.]|uniref:helix-turn-helix domain-containing protein n=1 Tax=uncultured Flavobacterium sp. TaxID=165435 RepID=UPI0030C848BC
MSNVYKINNFKENSFHSNLYVNTFKKHLEQHSFIESLHRHDFYVLVLFTKGSGTHKIDFDAFEIKAGSLFLMQPGQIHSWELSLDIEGYIVFYSQEIYNLHFGMKKIESYLFYQSSKNNPEIILNALDMKSIIPYFEFMIDENKTNKTQKKDKILNLLDCIHIEILRIYNLTNEHKTHVYNYKLKEFELLLEKNFRTEKAPSFYATSMAISLKHLNRISKIVLNKTITELIANRVILESKRILVEQKKTIAQVANELGYDDYSYFTKLFKKHTGITPKVFLNQIK